MAIGKLYLVPVPIGNYADITYRAIEILKEVDLILAEDTRTAGILLAEFGIETSLISYHQHNEQSRTEQIISRLETGENIALISDAGMPCISDPGSIIVKNLIAKEIEIVALPGANAALTCLAASGLNTDYFTFFGFLPVKGKERIEQLKKIADHEFSIILYEAPHRILKTLKDLIVQGLGKRRIVAGRELTKKYETYVRDEVENVYQYYQKENPRGEFVLVLEGQAEFSARIHQAESKFDEGIEQQVIEDLRQLLHGGMKIKSAVNFLSDKYKTNKNKLYQIALEFKDR
ncbi:MAG TPA: 16S rRNA (cytidine(1402)-2'-O)-methyltransferase [Clostridiaceae bacterium]|nr:16S rRNA (cytidine(1402)-2'-O)-methyltransferase [Clostridiaceae bacterium]